MDNCQRNISIIHDSVKPIYRDKCASIYQRQLNINREMGYAHPYRYILHTMLDMRYVTWTCQC